MQPIKPTIFLFEPHPFRRQLYCRHLHPFAEVQAIEAFEELSQAEEIGSLAVISLGDVASDRENHLIRLVRVQPRVPLILFDTQPFNEAEFENLVVQAHCNRITVPLARAVASVASFLKSPVDNYAIS